MIFYRINQPIHQFMNELLKEWRCSATCSHSCLRSTLCHSKLTIGGCQPRRTPPHAPALYAGNQEGIPESQETISFVIDIMAWG